MKNFKKLFDLLLIILGFSLVLRIVIKFFILHEGSFKIFLMGFVAFAATFGALLYTYFNPPSSKEDIIQFTSRKKGDNVLNVWALITGAVGLYCALFISIEKTEKVILGICGAIFLLMGISTIILNKLPEPKNIEEIKRYLKGNMKSVNKNGSKNKKTDMPKSI